MKTCTIDGCDKIHRAKGLCSMHWKQQHGKPTRYAITCQTCGVEHMSARPDGKFCSDECKGRSYQRTRSLVGPVPRDRCELPDRHPARRPQSKPHVWYAGSCRWCGDNFVDWQPLAAYCSRRCSKQHGKARRGVFVIPRSLRWEIYERDAWTCQLCMELVDQELTVLDPCNDWAASLDHIICQSWRDVPDHSASNLRLAHRWCNAVRGDESVYSESHLRISHTA